jgi:hypothetical protein
MALSLTFPEHGPHDATLVGADWPGQAVACFTASQIGSRSRLGRNRQTLTAGLEQPVTAQRRVVVILGTPPSRARRPR